MTDALLAPRAAPLKLLFVRSFRQPTGGHIKVRDYFLHCLAHRHLDPYLHFAGASTGAAHPLWSAIPAVRMACRPTPTDYHGVFLAGLDWALLEALPGGLPPEVPVCNLVQHVRHADPCDPRFGWLRRPALRICVSEEVAVAIRPYANGPVETIPNGIPLERFALPDAAIAGARAVDVLVLGTKRPALARDLAARLPPQVACDVVLEQVPRDELAARMRRATIFVGLPNVTEGFYLPALEAMAAGCAVICADAVGNRGFCQHERTALMPTAGVADAHVAAVLRLRGDAALRRRLVEQGRRQAAGHSLEWERDRFYAVLARHGWVPTGGSTTCATLPLSGSRPSR